MQMTVGRYYTPVGRLIQTPYENGDRREYYKQKFANEEDALYNVEKYKRSIPDSLRFRTDHGRTVFGGGGILPDYVVAPDTSLSTSIRWSQVDAAFASKWFRQHEKELRSTWQNRRDEFVSSYTVPNEAISGFWDYAESEEVLTLTTNPEEVNPTEQVFLKSEADDVTDMVKTRMKDPVTGNPCSTKQTRSLIRRCPCGHPPRSSPAITPGRPLCEITRPTGSVICSRRPPRLETGLEPGRFFALGWPSSATPGLEGDVPGARRRPRGPKGPLRRSWRR